MREQAMREQATPGGVTDDSVTSLGAGRRLPLIHFAADSALWALAFPMSIWLRYDYSFSKIEISTLFAVIGAIGLQGEFGWFLGQYRRRWRYGSFDEIRGVGLAAIATGAVLTLLLWNELTIPRSVPILATWFSLLGHIATRSFWRLYKEKQSRPGGDDLTRLVVVGAGDGAAQIIQIMTQTSTSLFVPVGIVDDDRGKRNLQIAGVDVLGTVAQLPEIAARLEATAVLIAVPSADRAFIRSVTEAAEAVGLTVYVLPPVDQLFGNIKAADIRPVAYEDLLGRQPAAIDTSVIASYITGRRVLVTGAGGSIGSEICRQLTKFGPSDLFMLDRDESGLHGTQLSIEGRALLEDSHLVLADIRDRVRVDEIFASIRPDVVFHTAALKHLPLLEMYPDEGWKTNVGGTLNLLDAAGRHGVTRFVNVSTDKAAAPTSVLGWTKRITERLTAHANSLSSTEFVSVRFGNVLGSNGSVLKSFEAQAATGGPITVTHPDISRFFMTIEEASRLTIHAGAIGQPGEIMILDMGQPVKIIDVAQRFANQHKPPLEIVFTGLRHNEKLHEDLVSPDEVGVIKSHPLITHVDAPPLAPVDSMLGGPVPHIDGMVELALAPVVLPKSEVTQ
jgi:FlaA1/EpsC-like NDP-sugar epimerase